MVLDELLSLRFSHAIEWIVGASEVSSEALESLNYTFFNLDSLFIGDAGAKRVTVKVSSDSDTGALNHSSIFLGEGRGNEFGCVHIRGMFICLLVFVVVRYDEVKEVLKLVVRVVAACIHTNT
jgi:hypothetical protein